MNKKILFLFCYALLFFKSSLATWCAFPSATCGIGELQNNGSCIATGDITNSYQCIIRPATTVATSDVKMTIIMVTVTTFFITMVGVVAILLSRK